MKRLSNFEEFQHTKIVNDRETRWKLMPTDGKRGSCLFVMKFISIKISTFLLNLLKHQHFFLMCY